MSDLHGQYDKFISMLSRIDFKESDTLYILGDIFDRGDKVLELIDYISIKKNIVMLLGNHDNEVLNALENGDFYFWFSYGSNTYKKMLNRGEDYIFAVKQWLKKLPLYAIVDDKYILSHATPIAFLAKNIDDLMKSQEDDTLLWNRSTIGNENNNVYKDYIFINGHILTPTFNKEPNIVRRVNTIYIDCGACFTDGRLACLRLDDMQEFYI